MALPFDPGFGPLRTTRLRVVSWNVWGRYGPWAGRQPIIVDNLRAIDPDIVCLQEAWRSPDRSQPDEIASALGMTAVYAGAFEINGASSGNAILTRWPVLRHNVVSLPMEGGGAVDTDEGEARVALMAEVDGPRGLFQVFCTHLSWRADWSGVRRAQVEAVCRFVASTRPRSFPAIVCGDFNAVPTSDEIRMLTGEVPVPVPGVVFRDAWATAGRGPGATISNRNPYVAASLEPDIRIDYIFVGWPKLGGAGQVLDAWVAGDVSGGSGTSNELFGSDHFAVVAELRY